MQTGAQFLKNHRFPLGLLLGPSWDPPGAVLGHSWAPLGSSWALLGRSWGALGRSWAVLDATKNGKKPHFSLSCCFLAALGSFLAPLGLILGPPGLILRALGRYFGLSMAFPRRFPPTFLAKLSHQDARNMCGNFSVGLRQRFAGNCWELGVPAHGTNRWGPPWGAAVSAKRSTIN